MNNDEVDNLARDLPRLTLQGHIPTATTMALAARVVELLDEKAKLVGWPPITDSEEAMLVSVAMHNVRMGHQKTGEAILRLLKRPPEL